MGVDEIFAGVEDRLHVLLFGARYYRTNTILVLAQHQYHQAANLVFAHPESICQSIQSISRPDVF